MTLVSVVIPTYNAEASLPTQLDALAAQRCDGEWEVIVADNGSRDRTVDVARAWESRLPGLRIADASAVRGAAAARNGGAALAQGRCLLFTDADDAVGEGWLQAYASTVGEWYFATGPITHFRSDDPPSRARPVSEPKGLPHMGFLPYAAGSNFAVDRALFVSAGGFDERFLAGEDVEFSWRLQLGGTPLVVLSGAHVAVRERTRAKDIVRQYYRYGLSDPPLYRHYRVHGVPRQRLGELALTYSGLVARLPLLGSAAHRRAWQRQMGRRAGRFVGSWRARTLYP